MNVEWPNRLMGYLYGGKTNYWKTIGGIAVGVSLVALATFLGLSGLGDLES